MKHDLFIAKVLQQLQIIYMRLPELYHNLHLIIYSLNTIKKNNLAKDYII